MPDAEGTKGEKSAGTPPDTGEQNEGDAGQNQTGGTKGDSGPDLQAAYNRGAKETREALQGKIEGQSAEIEQLRAKLTELEGNRKKPESDEEMVTKREVDELRERLNSEIEKRDEGIAGANRALAETTLIRLLDQAGVIKPEFAARVLADQVKADVTKGLDHFEVYTPEGTRMLAPDGDGHASVADLVAAFVNDNPELVRDNTRTGSGFGRGKDAEPTSAQDKINKAAKSKDWGALDIESARALVGGGR